MKFAVKKILDKFYALRGIGFIGFTDIISSGITGIFWLYVASILDPNEYGEISFLISMGAISSVFSLIGTQYTIIVLYILNILTFCCDREIRMWFNNMFFFMLHITKLLCKIIRGKKCYSFLISIFTSNILSSLFGKLDFDLDLIITCIVSLNTFAIGSSISCGRLL